MLFQPSDSVVEIFQQDTWKPLVLFSKDSFRGFYLKKKKCNSVHFPSLYYPEHQIAANSYGADSLRQHSLVKAIYVPASFERPFGSFLKYLRPREAA